MRCFGDREAPSKGPAAPKPGPPAGPTPGPTAPAVPARDPSRRPHDGSRTRVEARIGFPEPGEESDEIPTPTRRFTVMETTSGWPDDSREADEKEAERRLRDLRGRVKHARALVGCTLGLAEVLGKDPRRAAMFYSRFGVTETQFRRGVLTGTVAAIQERA